MQSNGEKLERIEELLAQLIDIRLAFTKLEKVAPGLHGDIQLAAAQESHIDLTAALARHGEDILHHVGSEDIIRILRISCGDEKALIEHLVLHLHAVFFVLFAQLLCVVGNAYLTGKFLAEVADQPLPLEHLLFPFFPSVMFTVVHILHMIKLDIAQFDLQTFVGRFDVVASPHLFHGKGKDHALAADGFDFTEGVVINVVKGSVKQAAQYDNRNQNTEFKRKQLAQCRPDCGISDGKWDCPLQNALRTNILAEERISHPDRIRCKHRQKNHKNNKDDVFQIPQRL